MNIRTTFVAALALLASGCASLAPQVDRRQVDYPDDGRGDVSHGLQVISLLSQLVNIAKISRDVPVTRSLEILP